jgi:hypothetical protein
MLDQMPNVKLNPRLSLSFQIIASPSLRGFYDASTESSNWMKNIRSTEDGSAKVNIQHIFINGQVSPRAVKYSSAAFITAFLSPPKQIWYEVTCDIPEDSELLLGPKVPLLISDMRREADDRSGSGS